MALTPALSDHLAGGDELVTLAAGSCVCLYLPRRLAWNLAALDDAP